MTFLAYFHVSDMEKIHNSVDDADAGNPSRRLKEILIKWLSFGVGFAVMCGILLVVSNWYSTRPKPWDRSAIIASFDSFDLESKSYNLILYYILENTTSKDYELQPDSKSRMMQKLKKQDSLIDGSGVLYDNPIFVPAKKKLRFSIMLDATFKEYFPSNILKQSRDERSKVIASFVNKEMANLNGFVLFDEANRYEIDFPRNW